MMKKSSFLVNKIFFINFETGENGRIFNIRIVEVGSSSQTSLANFRGNGFLQKHGRKSRCLYVKNVQFSLS
jgi:hypothetical protein